MDDSAIVIKQLGFSDLKGKPNIHWAEEELRPAHGLGIYFLDFESLPWTAAIVASPRDHVLVSLPQNSVDLNDALENLGPHQASWISPFVTSLEIRKQFLKELKMHGLASKVFPQGFLPYDGDLIDAPPVGFNEKVRALNNLWFRSYLIPRTVEARTNFALAMRVFWEERGHFFLRRFEDHKLLSEDYADRFMGGDPHYEALLFRNIYLGSNGQLQSNPQIAILESFIEKFPDNPIDFSDASPNFNEWVLQIGYSMFPAISKREYVAMSQAERNVDKVNSLRSHIVRLLQWPVFIQGAIIGRSRAMERFSKGPQVPSGILPYDVIEEIDEFLRLMKEKFPSYWSNIWDDIWAPRTEESK
jgi:hypothetical protein